MVELTLLTRAYCHLCDDMRDALIPLASAAGATVQEIDIDVKPALEAQWGDKVPVLLAGERELSRYRLDAQAVERFLAEQVR